MLAGIDGSGHVALLHLYHKHIFPFQFGFIPEFWDGMPFPVFYPPLFYWMGASLMSVFGIDATLAAKIVTTFSFLLLPFALFRLGLSLKLSLAETTIAVCFIGVIACGTNVVAFSGIGLLGLFEIGLYTQTLGFAFACLWISALLKAHESNFEAFLAVIFLAATILSNVHILPFVGAFAFFWFAVKLFNLWQIRREVTRNIVIKQIAFNFAILFLPLLLAGIWLFPLIWFYRFSVGQPLSSEGVMFSLGSFNLIWAVCLIVLWTERKRNIELWLLSLTLIFLALVISTSIYTVFPMFPFQPKRILSATAILTVFPLVSLLARWLNEAFAANTKIVTVCLAFGVIGLAWLHPNQKFGVSGLENRDAEEIVEISEAIKVSNAKKVLVEIIDPNSAVASQSPKSREMPKTRALAHQIAMSGTPVLWNVFREQAVNSPFATAVNNLFSDSKETFGLDGFALQLSTNEETPFEMRLKLAREIGVSHFLLKSSGKIEMLRKSSEIEELWEKHGWHFFKFKDLSNNVKNVVPFFAWLPAKFKNRAATDFDFFNLAETVAFKGKPEIPVLWANSPNTNALEVISKPAKAILVISNDELTPDFISRLKPRLSENQNLRVIIVSAKQSANIPELKEFSGQITEAELDLNAISDRIIELQNSEKMCRIMQTKSLAYFPTLTTSSNTKFLDGYGRVFDFESCVF